MTHDESTSLSHTGVQEWTAFSPDSQVISQAAYDAGLAVGRSEIEAITKPAPSTTMRPRIEARSIWDDWSPSCDE